jgi:hypothetical protein
MKHVDGGYVENLGLAHEDDTCLEGAVGVGERD